MDYSLDEQQQDVRDLAAGVIARRTADYPAEAPTGADWFDRPLWSDLGKAGLLGIALPEEYGGSGAGFVELCLLVEEAAKAGARVPLVETAVLAALPLARFGTDEQRERLLAPYCAGEAVLTAAVRTEGLRSVPVTAVRADGGWRLTGTASHVHLADVASRVLVAALEEGRQLGWFLLDPTGAGVTLTPQSSIDRAPRWHLTLQDALVEEADVLCPPGKEALTLGHTLEEHGVAARCVSQVGSADAALRMTAQHVSEREQFGAPVGTFQAVAHRVADAYIDLTGARLTTWRAVWLLADEEPAAEALAIAAWWASDAPSRIGESAMHLHGGISVDLDYPLHRYYLAVRQGEVSLGGPSRRLAALGELVAVAS